MSSAAQSSLLRRAVLFLLVPALLYLALFHLYTAPLLGSFNTHLFCGLGDGLANVWNLWWVNKAVTELHQSPWFTTYIHYPAGISLYYHTLSPYNAFAGIPLQLFLSLGQTMNLLVVSAFVLGGVTAFLLAWQFTRSYWPSLLAGFIFTFSSYHFAHGAGHLNLITIQWLPLFAMLFSRFLRRPSITLGISAGVALGLNLLADYYYFFYCLLFGAVLLAWFCWTRRSGSLVPSGRTVIAALALLLSSLALTAPLAVNFLNRIRQDTPLGSHHPERYSLDALALFIPGGHWRFSSLTAWFWDGMMDANEGSVFLGLSVTALLVHGWFRRRELDLPSYRFWYLSLVGFAALAMGPVFHVLGREIAWVPMPYRLLELLFPPIRVGGVPIRMVVMVTLCAAVLSAAAFRLLLEGRSRWRWLIVPLLLSVLFIEYSPDGLPCNQPYIDDYVHELAALDEVAPVLIKPFLPPTIALYHQTIHQQPISIGYTARTTERVRRTSDELITLLKERKVRQIRDDYGFRLLIAGVVYAIPADCRPTRIYRNEHAACIYDLATLRDDAETGDRPPGK